MDDPIHFNYFSWLSSQLKEKNMETLAELIDMDSNNYCFYSIK